MLRHRPHPVNLSRTFESAIRRYLCEAISGLPISLGSPICVIARPKLTAHCGKLLSSDSRGTPVHAASFIRQRQIVVETALLDRPKRLIAIVIHELFHFVWSRMGNSKRTTFEELLRMEIAHRARGELGESAAVAKRNWYAHRRSVRAWRNYVCESFCDSASAIYAPGSGEPQEGDFGISATNTLARRWRKLREEWFVRELPLQGWRC